MAASRASGVATAVATLGALAIVLSASPAAHAAVEKLVAPPNSTTSYVAHVLVPTVARSKPSVTARAVSRVATQTQWAHGPMRLLVLGSARVPDGHVWLLVRLPIRPNTAQGWILEDDTAVAPTPWRIVVDRGAHTITVVRGNALVRQASVVIGKPATPTPHGLFAIYERARQPAGSDLGPWALHLTAHSNVLFDFGGGPGRVALHGRAGDLLADPLGTSASHGCVRMDNDVVAWIAAHVQAGTPVVVV